MMKSAEFFKLHAEILEKLFPPNWFVTKANSNHPAYARWALCKKLIAQDGVIRYPQQKAELSEIARIVLDSVILIAITKGNTKQLKIGSLNLFGDETVQKKILSRITDPGQFEDLMVELSFAGWHNKKNHNVVPWEKEGYPDLKLEMPSSDIPICAECKNLRSVSPNRIIKDISKANSQIKAVSESHYGIVVLDVSIPAAIGLVEDNTIPERIKEIQAIIQSALNGNKNRSIGMAVLLWDEYKIIGKPPSKTLIIYKRRHVNIPHIPDVQPALSTLPIFNGFWTSYRIFWKN